MGWRLERRERKSAETLRFEATVSGCVSEVGD